ncbi:MAG: ATP-binding protein [Fibrobacteria bacterium]|nr:ATP-binding protein [Fibrobacteria bacterium]
MVKRELEKDILGYLSRIDEHPNVLLLEGARQVGKTTLIHQIRDQLEKNLVYVNLEEERKVLRDIDSCEEFSDFSKLLQTRYNFRGDGSAVLCIDEAQESNMLGGFIRFMKEKWHHTNVILTGSSMSRIFKKGKRFPVGRVTRFLLQPFNYREFLQCGGKELLLDMDNVPNSIFSQPEFIHHENLEMLQAFIDVGGLPAVVVAYFKNHDWHQLRENLYLDYKDDFSRIFSEEEAGLFDNCVRGIANNLGSPSLYSQVVKTTSRLYKKSPDFLTLLENWKLVHKLDVRSAHVEGDSFVPKRYLYDIGISQTVRLSALPRIDIISQLNAALRTPLGGIIENLLALELVALKQDLTGWKKGNNSYEVDFIYTLENGNTIPVECKAALHNKASHASGLEEYARRNGSPGGVLINLAPPQKWKTRSGMPMISIPVYYAGYLPQLVPHLLATS